MQNSKPIRILSIDGGGVRGIIPARILKELEVLSGKSISQLFDLIVGTSTGGIIALGLSCPNQNGKPKYRAQDILDLYLKESPQIFSHSLWHTLLSGGGLWGAKYDRGIYDTILHEFFGNAQLSQALCPVVIPTYSLNKGAPNLFSSSGPTAQPTDYWMRDIAGATSAAPTYFAPKTFTDLRGGIHIEIDGGIFANNPETIGVTEAYRLFPDINRSNICIISIGTGSPKLSAPANTLTNAGVIGWVMKANLIDIMMDADSEWYNEEISSLYPNSHRLQAAIPISANEMDNATPDNLNNLLEITEAYLNANQTLLQAVANICMSANTST